MNRFFAAAFAAILAAAPALAQIRPTNARTLESSLEVIDELTKIPGKGIPAKLLEDAQGIAIIPRVIKAGFVFGGRGGHGIVLAKDKDGNWGDPTFVNLGGASVGFQAGVSSSDVVLVFRTRKSLDRLLEGKGKITLGADAAVAAGPVGRQVAAATDARLQAEIVSYSRSRGLFAGVSLDGAAIRTDEKSNDRLSDSDAKLLADLKTKLASLSVEPQAPPPGTVPPPASVPSTPFPPPNGPSVPPPPLPKP